MDLGSLELSRRVAVTKLLCLLGKFRVPVKTSFLEETPLPLSVHSVLPSASLWELVPEAALTLCVCTAGQEVQHETRRRSRCYTSLRPQEMEKQGKYREAER